MKLKKDQFKTILKECIIELIDEGAFDKVLTESLQSSSRVATSDFVNSSKQNPYQASNSSKQLPANLGHTTPNQRLQEISRMTAELASKGDAKQASMLTNIFEDTARTTLQEQLAQGGGAAGGNLYVGEQSNSEQDALDKAQLDALSNGMGASRWASVAFANLGKKK